MNIKKNDYYVCDVVDMNNLGYGIAKIDGVAAFIDGAVTKDKIKGKVIKAAKSYVVMRLEEIIEPSPYRVKPDCPVFARCGGCSFRHVSREYELQLKKEIVKSVFKKQGMDAVVNDVVSDGKADGYRNKAQYPVDCDGDFGYYAKHSHNIVKTDACALVDEKFNEITSFVSSYIKENKIKVKHIYLRRAQKTGQIMLCLVIPTKSFKGEERFVKEAVSKFPEICSVVLNIHPEQTNVILGKEVRVIYGEDIIYDILCGCKFGISSLSFYQVNRGCAELLYYEGIKRASEVKPKKAADLYCGAGTIGISFAKNMAGVSVSGVEIVPEAVENAKANAALNGIKNAEFICADALEASLDGFDCVIVDPPRKGMSEALINKIISSGIKKLVYISCEPSTLARDAKILTENGYRMSDVTPFDMFPRTGAVECVTDFEKII